jgi:hypothetical protein
VGWGIQRSGIIRGVQGLEKNTGVSTDSREPTLEQPLPAGLHNTGTETAGAARGLGRPADSEARGAAGGPWRAVGAGGGGVGARLWMMGGSCACR